jgi:hypothetical protein
LPLLVLQYCPCTVSFEGQFCLRFHFDRDAEGMGTPLSAGGVRGVPSSPRTHAVALAYTARRIAIDLALRRATKDRFVGIRTRIVSQLLEKLLRVE